METLLLTGKTLNVIKTLGLDVIIHTIQSTTSIIGSSISYITSIECSSIDSIKTKLQKIDIEKATTIIHLFINELNSKKDIKDFVKISIISINEILQQIESDLNSIKKDIEYHITKYFSSWRSINCDIKLNNIEVNSNILEKRFELLIKLLSVNTI